ncbi:uncharacterized protein EAF01_008515 [Botrytis porri]|uniref:uncharacterized protein n=1 Tax=Botrytis porri TaxID=87229 RepID=UPI0019013474|nr:uncharacterized protein EAF01_008515 [Botrytis porri]KAF7899302.1 hypothetical protein EAF01_008515 [Botrytis porri]
MNAEVQYFQYLAQSAGTDRRVRRCPTGSVINSQEYQRVSSPTSSHRRRPTLEFTDWDFLSEWERSTQPKKKHPKSEYETSENLVSNPKKPIPERDTLPRAQDESLETPQETDPHKPSRKNNGTVQRYINPASILLAVLMFSILSHSFFSGAENFVKNVLEALLVRSYFSFPILISYAR